MRETEDSHGQQQIRTNKIQYNAVSLTSVNIIVLGMFSGATYTQDETFPNNELKQNMNKTIEKENLH